MQSIKLIAVKSLLTLSIPFLALCAQAQSDAAKIQTDSSSVEFDSVEVQFVALPDSTGIGAPDGKLVSKEIGPSGGNIVSDDGRVELIFPQGALVSTTTISIQPITNLIPNGSGKAYQFEPSGLHFAKAAELIFHYSKGEAENCPAFLKFMAIQSGNGKWEYLDYENWDSAAGSLKGHISHFSQFVDGAWYDLDPTEKSVKVGESFGLTLTAAVGPGEDALPPLPGRRTFRGKQLKWSVEGGAKFGTITGGSTRWAANYTAPQYLPNKNAKVILKVDSSFIQVVVQHSRGRARGWVGRTRVPRTMNLATFECNVKLYDKYRITIIKTGASVLKCGAELDDRSIFQATFYPDNVEIDDPFNSAPTLTTLPNCPPSERGGRRISQTLIYDAGGCEGPVDVNKDKKTNYDVSSNGETVVPPDITLEFVPYRVKIMNGKIRSPSTPGANTNSHFLKRQLHLPAQDVPDERDDAEDVNVGNEIKFKGDRSRQEYTRPGDSPEHSFKLIIEAI